MALRRSAFLGQTLYQAWCWPVLLALYFCPVSVPWLKLSAQVLPFLHAVAEEPRECVAPLPSLCLVSRLVNPEFPGDFCSVCSFYLGIPGPEQVWDCWRTGEASLCGVTPVWLWACPAGDNPRFLQKDT